MRFKTKIISKKTSISEVLAIAGIILLSIDTANIFIGQGEYGFSSPLNDQQSGILLGIPSIILFFVAFGLGFRDKSRLTSLSIHRSDHNGFCHNGTGVSKILQGDKLNKNYKRLAEAGKNARM